MDLDGGMCSAGEYNFEKQNKNNGKMMGYIWVGTPAVLGFGGDLGFGRQGVLLVSFSFHLVSVWVLTSLPLELWFGWGGEWGLSRCWRAPRGC
jgi:hypothetical protein